MARPTEASILENYLLLPSRLPTVISLREFTSFFPKAHQSSPQIRSLYRDLQQQRNAVVDMVERNIDRQLELGPALRRDVIRARRDAQRADEEEEDEEVVIESNVRSLPLQLQFLRVLSAWRFTN
jgi:centromere-localized protein 2